MEMEKTKTPGKGLLKVMGIIELVFGGISSIMVFIGLTSVETLNLIQPLNYGMSWQMLYIWQFIVICYCIFVGIMAVMHCATLEKSSSLKKLGIIMLVIVIIDGIIAVAFIGISSIVLIPISIALSSLIIVGANKNEKEFNEVKTNS